MRFWEVLIVCIGLSLDVFAVTACEGAVLARVRLDRLAMRCAVFSLWQVVACILGRLAASLPRLADVSAAAYGAWRTLSGVIFLALGALLLYKALRNKPFVERRTEIPFRKIVAAGALVSIDAFFAGVSFEFLQTRWLLNALCLFVVSVLSVVGGIYTGYHFGYEQRTKAYWIGGILFVAAAVDVFVHYLV